MGLTCLPVFQIDKPHTIFLLLVVLRRILSIEIINTLLLLLLMPSKFGSRHALLVNQLLQSILRHFDWLQDLLRHSRRIIQNTRGDLPLILLVNSLYLPVVRTTILRGRFGRGCLVSLRDLGIVNCWFQWFTPVYAAHCRRCWRPYLR